MEDIRHFDDEFFSSSYSTEIPIVKNFLDKNFPYLEKMPRIYKGLERYLDQGSYAAVFKIKGKNLALRIEVGGRSELSHYNFWEKIMNEQKKGNFKSFKKVVYMEKKELGNGKHASIVISKLYKQPTLETMKILQIALKELYPETFFETNNFNYIFHWQPPTNDEVKQFKLNIRNHRFERELLFLANSFIKIHNDIEELKNLGFKIHMVDIHSENIMQDEKNNLILIDF